MSDQDHDPELRLAMQDTELIIEATATHIDNVNAIGAVATAGALSAAVGLVLEVSGRASAATADFMPVPKLGILAGVVTLAGSGLAGLRQFYKHRNTVARV